MGPASDVLFHPEMHAAFWNRGVCRSGRALATGAPFQRFRQSPEGIAG